MLTGSPPTVRRHPPLLGEHSEEILAESGYTPGQISELRQKKVIAG
jgi:formyl-CoA transferase